MAANEVIVLSDSDSDSPILLSDSDSDSEAEPTRPKRPTSEPLRQLVAMGFCEPEARRALNQAGGVVVRAADALTSQAADAALALSMQAADAALALSMQAAEYTAQSQPQTRQRPRALWQRVGSDGRIRWRSDEEDIESWLAAAPPSRVSADDAEWLQVCNNAIGSPGQSLSDDDRYCSLAYGNILQEQARAVQRGEGDCLAPRCTERLLQLATQQGYTMGKWLMFVSPNDADAAWATVARATARGELGASAKVAPGRGAPANRGLLICIYLRDFNEKHEVRRVLLKLRELMPNGVSGFKPDVFTALGIGTGNAWRLKPTIYSVQEVLGWQAQ